MYRPLVRPVPLAVAALLALLSPLGHAQPNPPSLQTVSRIAIDAKPLAQALSDWALQTHIQLIVDPALVAGRTAPAVSGELSARQALDRLLAGSGLAPSFDGIAVVIKPAAAQGSGNALSTVTVTAGRDATTEGLDNYAAPATTIGLGEHSLRETPNSVSVVTRQRIEDQNMRTVEEAMQYTTGMKVTSYGTTSGAVESRGYTIDHYQIDGLSSSARVYENNFSLAMFDRLEVMRGPSGLLQGVGDPGGTINFVRKRAQNTFGFNASTSIGSWDNYYADFDVTGPLSEDGRLRGRLVAAYQDRHYFTDYAFTRQPMLYGTLEYDITPDTTLSIGTSWQRNRSRPFFGLAAYENGTFPKVARSTYMGAEWNSSTQESGRTFAELEHKLEGGGKARLLAAYVERNNRSQFAWGNSFADPLTGNVDMIPYYSTGKEREASIDARVTLPFQWGGLKQELVFGANYQRLRSDSNWNSGTWGENGFVQNIYLPQVNVYKPVIALDGPSATAQTQSAVYGQARIKPWEPLTLIAGARVASFKNENRMDSSSSLSANGRVVPYGGIVYDVSRDFSVYGSYSSIFSPQSDTDYLGNYLAPRKGKQAELGVKGSHFEGQLESSMAVYRIDDVNRAMTDPDHPNSSIAAGKVRSQGAEFELTGKLTPNWKITAGYGYNDTKQVRASDDQQGKPFTTTFPRHTFSLWSDYRFTEGGLQGLNLGFGMKVRSSIYSVDGSTEWRQGGVTVFAIQAGYQITPRLKATVTLNNLFDKRYFDRPEGWSRQLYYGEPRNVMLTLAYKM